MSIWKIWKNEKGFAITELAIAVVVLTALLASGWQGLAVWQEQQRREAAATATGQQLKLVGDAVKTYATLAYVEIQKEEPFSKNGATISGAEVRRPTIAQLRAIGVYPTSGPDDITFSRQALGVLIEITPETAGCTAPNCTVRWRLRTSVGLTVDGQINDGAATTAAAAAGPSRAGVATTRTPGRFRSPDGTELGINESGQAGLIALYDGYESGGFDAFLRRDGSLPMTGTLKGIDATMSGNVASDTLTPKKAAREGDSCAAYEVGTIATQDDSGTKTGLLLSCQSGASGSKTWKLSSTMNCIDPTKVGVGVTVDWRWPHIDLSYLYAGCVAGRNNYIIYSIYGQNYAMCGDSPYQEDIEQILGKKFRHANANEALAAALTTNLVGRLIRLDDGRAIGVAAGNPPAIRFWTTFFAAEQELGTFARYLCIVSI